jgi:hypothetical protein
MYLNIRCDGVKNFLGETKHPFTFFSGQRSILCPIHTRALDRSYHTVLPSSAVVLGTVAGRRSTSQQSITMLGRRCMQREHWMARHGAAQPQRTSPHGTAAGRVPGFARVASPSSTWCTPVAACPNKRTSSSPPPPRRGGGAVAR